MPAKGDTTIPEQANREDPASPQSMTVARTGRNQTKPDLSKPSRRHVYRTAGLRGTYLAFAHRSPLSLCCKSTCTCLFITEPQTDNEEQVMCVEMSRGHKRIYRSAGEAFAITDDKAGCLLAFPCCDMACRNYCMARSAYACWRHCAPLLVHKTFWDDASVRVPYSCALYSFQTHWDTATKNVLSCS